MSHRLFRYLTINQMLIISHLMLVALIITGFSFTRFASEWKTQVEHEASTARSFLTSQLTFFSGSVAGRNYANLMMPSTRENLRAVDNLIFAEVGGTSDYQNRTINVRYYPKEGSAWRTDVSTSEVELLENRLSGLEHMLTVANESEARKVKHLLNQTVADLNALKQSLTLTHNNEIPWRYADGLKNGYYLDEAQAVLHVHVDLINENGGHVWAVLDASSLEQIKIDIRNTIMLEAGLALFASSILILVVSYWLVTPLKRLSESMKQDIEHIDHTKLPESERRDEIGDLARAYSGLLVKIKNQLRILQEQTDTDALTGLGSRYLYQATSSGYVTQTINRQHYACFVLCDIDNFKKFNDTYGHIEGDNALCEVANGLRAALGADQPCFRMGGEEFAAILYGSSIEVFESKLERIRSMIEGQGIRHEKNLPSGVVTLSIGAVPILCDAGAVDSAECEEALELAIKQADENLYTAKDRGRNNVVVSEALNIANCSNFIQNKNIAQCL